ncbi:diguanylate cyclase domain-containing protein [Deinococcus roseus]|uniref:Diguanylate cyclase n=1 Tax=Deinococcus roseus TaxID=392414 RepID=A0ABQ2CYP8_9DEIO|nr:diguanylate cyclase [Deinococcus roseus]GGJ33486.1 hypothetical protein GCM10008938_19680 [Deinococcus roseus]
MHSGLTLQHILEALPGWVFVLNTREEHLLINAGFAQALKLHPTDLLGQRSQDLNLEFHLQVPSQPATQSGFGPLLKKALKDQKNLVQQLNLSIHQQGQPLGEHHVLCMAVPLGGPQGEHVLFYLQKQQHWDLRGLDHSRSILLQQIVDMSSSLIFAKDREGRFTLANRAFAEAYGTTPEQLLGKTDLDFQKDLKQIEKYREADLHVIENRIPMVIQEETVTDLEGNRRFLTTSKQFLNTPEHMEEVLGIATDITVLKQTREELLASEERYRELYLQASKLLERSKADLARTQALYRVSEALQEARTLQNLLDRICEIVAQAVSARWCSVFKLNHEERRVEAGAIRSRNASSLQMVEFEELMDGLAGWVIQEQSPAFSPKGIPDPRESLEVQAKRIQQKVGSVIVVPLNAPDRPLAMGTLTALNHLDDPDFSQEDLELMKAIASQVSVALTQRELLDRIEHMAFHDALTNLPNRLLFQDRLGQSLAQARRKQSRIAVLFIDLDGFKQVNDSLGHHVGDLLLQAVSERWKERIRESDTLARMSGDEFAIVLNDVLDVQSVERVAGEFLELVRKPFLLEGHEVHITASVGISIYPDDAADQHALLIHADHTMYQIKSNQKNDVFRRS